MTTTAHLAVRLRPELLAAVREHAEDLVETPSSLVRRLLAEAVGRPELAGLPKRRGGPGRGKRTDNPKETP